MVNQNDILKAKGEVKILVIDKEGKIISSETQNKVVNLGIEAMLKHINGIYTSLINYFKIGTGSNSTTETDAALQTPVNFTTLVATKAFDSVGYPSTKEIKYQLTVDFTEGNGNTLSEIGLFFADNRMFSRFTHQGINKTSYIKIVYQYTIKIE